MWGVWVTGQRPGHGRESCWDAARDKPIPFSAKDANRPKQKTPLQNPVKTIRETGGAGRGSRGWRDDRRAGAGQGARGSGNPSQKPRA